MSLWQRFLAWLRDHEEIEEGYPFTKPKRAVDRIFIHCSASDLSHHDDIGVIKQWHTLPKPIGNGWSDVGYHYFIKKNGEIQEGRDLRLQPAAQYPHNKGTIAICLHGLEESKFTQAQFDSLNRLCDSINEAYNKQVTFHGHNEVTKLKSCPVFDYKKVLGLDKEGRRG